MKLFVDVLGWFGVVLYLIAYWLVSTKRLPGDSIVYQLMNLGGGALLVVNTIYYGALPSIGVNVAWIGIAIFALIRKGRELRKASAGEL